MNISGELVKVHLQHPRDLVWIEGATGGFLKQVLKILQNLQECTYVRVSFFNEVAGLNFLQKGAATRVFPQEFCGDFEEQLETTTYGSMI